MPTIFLPPYQRSGQPVDVPLTQVWPPFPLNVASTVQLATSVAATGVMTLITNATVTLIAGQGLAAAAARPFLVDCFTAAQSKVYVVDFSYDFAFQVTMDAGKIGKGLKVRGVQSSRMLVQAIGEVFDANGAMVGSGFDNLYVNQALVKNVGPILIKGIKTLRVKAPLKKRKRYFWKFTFYAGVSASEATIVLKTAACDCTAAAAPGAPGAFGIKLKNVAINPNVTKNMCRGGPGAGGGGGS